MARSKPNVSGIASFGCGYEPPSATFSYAKSFVDAVSDDDRKELQDKLDKTIAAFDELRQERENEAAQYQAGAANDSRSIKELRNQLDAADGETTRLRAALDEAVKLHNVKVDENTILGASLNGALQSKAVLERQYELARQDLSQLAAKLQATQSALDVVSSDPPRPSLTERVKRLFTGSR